MALNNINNINIDRFEGECGDPPVIKKCSFCEEEICEGQNYIEYDEDYCMDCGMKAVKATGDNPYDYIKVAERKQ